MRCSASIAVALLSTALSVGGVSLAAAEPSASPMSAFEAKKTLAAANGVLSILDRTPGGEVNARLLALEINAFNRRLQIDIRRKPSPEFVPDVILSCDGAEKNAVAYTAKTLYVIVNRENKLDGLTLRQLREIYDGTYRDWKELTGSPYSIHRYAVPVSDPGNEIVSRLVLSGAAFAPTYRAFDARELQLLVGTNKHAIGFLSEPPSVRMPNWKIIAVDGVKPGAPNGGYPLIQPHFVAVVSDKPAAAGFAGMLCEKAKKDASQKQAKTEK